MNSQGKNHCIGAVIGAVVALVAAIFAAIPVLAADSAVIFMYHRFGEHEYPSTNITLKQFESHIKELASGGYSVLPVADIIDALRHGRPLPDRAIGITVDDAYLSVYTEAWPRLKRANMPFTLFVNTDAVNQDTPGSMNWKQLREMADSGVTIGQHTASHLHMAKSNMAQNRQEINDSVKRFEMELGKKPDLFAYPYGEASLALENLAKTSGIAAAFGQHSGAVGSMGNFYYLPRFAMNEKYGNISRFRLAAQSLSLPVSDVTPVDTLVTLDNPPAYGFTVAENIGSLKQLRCFSSYEGNAKILRLGKTRIEVRMKTPMPRGRSRINCTMLTREGRWRWLGRQFYVP